jgi:DNA-directed RNA polymerase subunit RPC12/RpoP
MEEWKICFESYEISNFGNCRKLLNNNEYKIINGTIGNRGYRYFQIKRNNKRQNFLFHQLVAKCFLGNKEDDKFVIDHIDRNKLNNNLTNLRYVSKKENSLNSDRVIINIQNPDRKQNLLNQWLINNKDKINERKKKYYEDNKNDILKKDKEIICSKCNNSRLVGTANFNFLKRKGIEDNVCKNCSSKINLEKIIKK